MRNESIFINSSLFDAFLFIYSSFCLVDSIMSPKVSICLLNGITN